MAGIEEQTEQVNTSEVENSADIATVQEIIQNIDFLIDEFTTKNNITDISALPQQQFTAILDYIRFNYFIPNKSILYKYQRGISNNGHISNQYNYYIVLCVVEYYIYLCHKYNKVASMYGVQQLTGIDDNNIMNWGNMESQHPQAFVIYKTLRKEYEKGLQHGAMNGKNPVGYIASLNHFFGWSADSKPTLTVNINRDSKQIMSTFDNSLTDNHS